MNVESMWPWRGRNRGLVTLAAVLVFAASMLGTGPTKAQQGSGDSPWVEEHPLASPLPRGGGVTAFHPPTERLVLFGGNSVGNVNDTWTWDGSRWQQELPLASPPARAAAVMAYHAPTGKLVLFGGLASDNSTALGDTWTWDGANWIQESPTTSPPARLNAAMTSDASGRLVLFGGYAEDIQSPFDDTWTWNGSNWQRESPATSPQPREGAAMAYHAPTGRAVLFGGRNLRAGPPESPYGDTWSWDGTNWTITGPGPAARHGASLTFLAATGDLVLFGGQDDQSVFRQDTWTWDGSNWTQRSPQQSPPARMGASLAYHAPSQRVVLFGGVNAIFTPLGDTWTWDGKEAMGGINPSYRTSLRLDPAAIPADGSSTSTATATVTAGGQGVAGLDVQIDTDGDVAIGPVTDHGDGTYTATITASTTTGKEKIRATGGIPPEQFLIGQQILTETPATVRPPSCTVSLSANPPPWTDLDPSFGCGGKVTTTISPGRASGMARQADGKVVMAASNQLLRYRPDGTPDTSFGTGGATQFAEDPTYNSGAEDVTLQRDGKILVLASKERVEGNEAKLSYRLYRFNANGTSDSGFGAAGSIDVSNGSGRVAVQDDGKILVLGLRLGSESPLFGGSLLDLVLGVVTGNAGSRTLLTRYNADGTLDSAFGDKGDGSIAFDYAPSSPNGGPGLGGMALQSDGKIVVVGSQCQQLYATYPNCAPAAARLTNNGVLDSSFNPCGQGQPPCGGVVVTPFETPVGNAVFGGSVFGFGVAIQPDGKIVLAGGGGASDGIGFVLIRYNVGVAGQPDGSLDSTFNPCGAAGPPCGGKVQAPTHFEGYQSRSAPTYGPPDSGIARSVAVQPDGKIVLAGSGPVGAGDFLLARYNSNGSLDTCGTPGYVRTYFGTSSMALDVAVQPDGRILAGGIRRDARPNNEVDTSVALARYMGGGTPPPTKVSIADTSVTEPGSGSAPAQLAVSLDSPACELTTVDFATVDGGSATPQADYTPTQGRATFQPGQATTGVDVPVVADDEVEDNEAFFVDLANVRTDPSSSLPPLPASPPADPTAVSRNGPISIFKAEGVATIVDADHGSTTPRSGGAPAGALAPPSGTPAGLTGSETPLPVAPTAAAVAGFVAGFPLPLPSPPPAPTQPITQAQSQTQAQQQAQQQLQQQAQAQIQAAFTMERERQAQTQTAGTGPGDAGGDQVLASERHRSGDPIPNPASAWTAAAAAMGVGMALKRQRSRGPAGVAESRASSYRPRASVQRRTSSQWPRPPQRRW